MGQSINTGESTITGTVATGITILSSNQTPINITGTGTGSVATIHTVTTGKKFAVFGGWVENGNWELWKPDGTTRLWRGAALTSFFSNIPIWTYESGEAVKFKTTSGQVFGVYGVEY